VGGVLAGGVPLWAVSPLVVLPPAVFGGCPPPVPLSCVVATFHCDVFCLLCRPGVWPTSRPTTRAHAISDASNACSKSFNAIFRGLERF